MPHKLGHRTPVTAQTPMNGKRTGIGRATRMVGKKLGDVGAAAVALPSRAARSIQKGTKRMRDMNILSNFGNRNKIRVRGGPVNVSSKIGQFGVVNNQTGGQSF